LLKVKQTYPLQDPSGQKRQSLKRSTCRWGGRPQWSVRPQWSTGLLTSGVSIHYFLISGVNIHLKTSDVDIKEKTPVVSRIAVLWGQH